MAHRGRLNVLANILRKPYEMIFAEFEGTFLPRRRPGRRRREVPPRLLARPRRRAAATRCTSRCCSNPSHLEAVNPVVEGIVRAKQTLPRRHRAATQVMPVLIHGDAAFTGQGIVAETLVAVRARAATAPAARSTSSSTTRSASPRSPRGLPLHPLPHRRRQDDPGADLPRQRRRSRGRGARGAAGHRPSASTFKVDVVIDLVCYRRHGHNEADDPTFTQPVMYKSIAAHPPVRDLYARAPGRRRA